MIKSSFEKIINDSKDGLIYDYELVDFIENMVLNNKNEIPPLFRYSPADYNNIRNLETERLFLSSLGGMNDIFEGISCEVDDSVLETIDDFSDIAFLKSFSEEKNNLLMWAHYAEDYSGMIENPEYIDAMRLGANLLNAFKKGEIGEIYLAYTHFKNTVVHEPVLMKLLPVEAGAQEEDNGENELDIPMNFEPAEQEALDLIIPKYVTSLIYGGMVESVASENGARMQAMDSATSNAEELIGKLTLQYNRVRQSSITQELTEIIAGANAIS